MPTSIFTKNGLLLFRDHPMAGFADGLHFQSGFGSELWAPAVVVPEAVEGAHCAHCGAALYGATHMQTMVGCRNHGPGTSFDYLTLIHRVKNEHWNGIRPLLNRRSEWFYRVWAGEQSMFDGSCFIDIRKHWPKDVLAEEMTERIKSDFLRDQITRADLRTFGVIS